MSRIVPLVVGALVLGLIAGFWIGRSRTPTSPNHQAARTTAIPSPPPQSVLPATEERRELPDDPVALKELVVQQRTTIGSLAARVAELERQPQVGKPVADKRAIAKEIYEAFLGLRNAHENGEGAGNYLKSLGRLDELDESVVSFFIEKYRKAQKEEEKELALGLAICCGGREAADFVKALLKDPSLGEMDRRSLLHNFGQWGEGAIFPSRPFPVDPELAQMALQLSESPKTEERAGAAGLLGHYDAPSSRGKLQQLASSDSEPWVRYSAIQALGRVGDRSTLAYLNSYPTPSVDLAYLETALKGALAKLKKKFPD